MSTSFNELFHLEYLRYNVHLVEATLHANYLLYDVYIYQRVMVVALKNMKNALSKSLISLIHTFIFVL